MNFIIAQILGGIALILVCIGYFVKKKSIFITIQIIANIFYASSYIFLNVLSAGIITIISTLRCIFIYFSEKYNFKYSFYFIPVFIIGYIATGIIFWQNIFDIIPIISGSFFTIGFFLKDLQLMRYILIIPNALLVAFGLLTSAYTVALLDAIEMCVLIIAIIKFHFKNKKEKREV